MEEASSLGGPLLEGHLRLLEGQWPLLEGQWPLLEGQWPLQERHLSLLQRPPCLEEASLLAGSLLFGGGLPQVTTIIEALWFSVKTYEVPSKI